MSNKEGACPAAGIGDPIVRLTCLAQRLMTAPELENSKVDRNKLIESFSAFVEGLIDKDHAKVEKHLLELSAQGDSSLYQKVGEMARGLHNSISDLREDLVPRLNSATQAVPQATDHLTGVIQMTNDAAHKTMALLDKNSSVVEKLKKICAGHSVPGLQELVTEAEQINTEILMAQEFQDLTGQALKKVINVLTELEKNLVELVAMFGSKAAPEAVAGPAPTAAPAGKQSQDDADAILASFGF